MREAWAAFAGSARMAVSVHSVPVACVRERVGFRAQATWLQVDRDLPVFVRRHVETTMAEGFAWRFAPLRVFPGLCEVTLATGCAVAPFARHLGRWATAPGQRRCVMARGRGGADGVLTLRGVPASFDVEVALSESLCGMGLLQTAEDVAEVEVAMLSAGEPPIVLGVGGKEQLLRESMAGAAR